MLFYGRRFQDNQSMESIIPQLEKDELLVDADDFAVEQLGNIMQGQLYKSRLLSVVPVGDWYHSLKSHKDIEINNILVSTFYRKFSIFVIKHVLMI